ncbi:flagellar hook-length control protein FliK [Arcobacter sp. FWKO B]|uniref:flagellar hook-length control protein FliK n=1 Tax=Arcobacter sp. FWKO B TaxID=2593672 RepID=UPI0018A548DF|nr:flagellar hook-length control protein FliK [Arcobacter sp. FWKO B]QOG12004.1 hypothetical protein FWKOB_04480 [Arcobacter sp. FWKO B]
MTKELSLFDTLVSTNTSQTSSDTKTSKEGSSLFDELLKSVAKEDVQQNPTSKQTTESSIKSQADTITRNDTTSKDVVSNDNTKAVDTKNNTKTTISSTMTELSGDNKNNIQTNISDKTIISKDEPKESVTSINTKTNNTQTQDNLINETKSSELKTTATQQIPSSSQTTKTVDEVEIQENNEQEIVRKPSMFDSLMMSAKKQTTVNDILQNIDDNTKETTTIDTKQSQNIIQQNSELIDKVKVTKEPTNPTNKVQSSVVQNEVKQSNNIPLTDSKLPTNIANENIINIVSKELQPVISDNSNQGEIIDNKDTQIEETNNTQQTTNKQTTQKSDNNLSQVLQSQNENIVVATPKELSSEDIKSVATTKIETNIDKEVVKDSSVSVGEIKTAPTDTKMGNIKEENTKTLVKSGQMPQNKLLQSEQKNLATEVIQKEEIGNITTKEESNLQNISKNTKQDTLIQESSKDTKENIVKEVKQENIIKEVKQESTILEQNSKSMQSVESTTKASDIAQNKLNAGTELSKLDSDEAKVVNIKKDDLQSLIQKPQDTNSPEKKEGVSLLDKLIQDSLKVGKEEIKTPATSLQQPTMIKAEEIDKSATDKSSFMENIYKSAVSKNATIAAMQNVATAKEIVKNGTSANDIKSSADMLNLNMQDIEDVTQSQNDEIVKSKTKDNTSFINRVILAKNTISQENIQKSDLVVDDDIKSTEIKSTQNTTQNTPLKVVEIEVREVEVLTIQNRIIGARQQLSSMMSDVARAMYENYKPPHTAFRINLNPANLGQIAILIRSQRSDNSLSISMNMTNSATLESVVASQNELRNALMKSFDDSHTFEFDFRLDKDGSNGSQYEQNSNENSNTTQEINESIQEEIQETEQEKNGTYF